ncbi:MAG: zinc ribbon domain-containing protein [Stellaceae bacterium]
MHGATPPSCRHTANEAGAVWDGCRNGYTGRANPWKRPCCDRMVTGCSVLSLGAPFRKFTGATCHRARRSGKATLDLSGSTLRNLLKYKCDHTGITFLEVDESYTTQACSVCGSIGGSKGREELGIRQWVCDDCGAVHDRDSNATMNIARLGCETLGLKWPGSPRL